MSYGELHTYAKQWVLVVITRDGTKGRVNLNGVLSLFKQHSCVSAIACANQKNLKESHYRLDWGETGTNKNLVFNARLH